MFSPFGFLVCSVFIQKSSLSNLYCGVSGNTFSITVTFMCRWLWPFELKWIPMAFSALTILYICSLILSWKVLPDCPTYWILHFSHVIILFFRILLSCCVVLSWLFQCNYQFWMPFQMPCEIWSGFHLTLKYGTVWQPVFF